MRLFLDSNIMVSAMTFRKPAARRLLDSSRELFTNEYALKEARRAMLNVLPVHEANLAIDELKRRVKVIASPINRDVQKIVVRDRSDKPIVCGAMQSGSVFVTDDFKTRQDAAKYVRAVSCEEALSL